MLGDILNGVETERKNIEKTLSTILQDCNLDSLVSVNTIKSWMKELPFENSWIPINMLTGLLPSQILQQKDLVEDLINSTIKLNHVIPLKSLNGETYKETLGERYKQGKLSQLKFSKISIPPKEWGGPYRKALQFMEKRQFFEARKKFDETFDKLLELKTTDGDIYRVFANAGLSYLATGKPRVGFICISIAHNLNPQYEFAADQLQKIEQGEFDDLIELGYLSQMKNNAEKWEARPDYLHLDIVMNWPEKRILDKLSSFGINLDKEEFISVAKTVNNPDDLAEKMFYPQAQITEENEDFFWIAAYVLWNIYCPDEPSISGFNDAIDEATKTLSKINLHNKKDVEKSKSITNDVDNCLKKLEHYIFTNKKNFLHDWFKTVELEDYSFQLKKFLIKLLSYSEFEKRVIRIVNHLNKHIPHPDWKSIEIIHILKKNKSKAKKVFQNVQKQYPFNCYLATEIAEYYINRNEYSSAEFYLKKALKTVDRRVSKNKFSIDSTFTTIYGDYTLILDLFETVYDKKNATSREKNWLKKKRSLVEKNADYYSKSPADNKINEIATELFYKKEKKEAQNSLPIQYYKFLEQFDINFETNESPPVDKNILPIDSKNILQSKSKRTSHWKKSKRKKKME